MCPMTRNRATKEHIPTEIMAKYYGQRAGAGLIITEGASPSINGAGYTRMPGIYTPAQTEAWKKVTEEVHKEDGKIFLQLMHTGRIAHTINMDEGAEVLSSSAVCAENSDMYTDKAGIQRLPIPKAMDKSDNRSGDTRACYGRKKCYRSWF